MKKENQQTPDNALEQALQSSIKGTRHARKLITRFVTALLQVRTSNLAKVANAVESDAESDSVYRQIQRFLKNENKVSIDFLKLLKLTGKLKILIDRTEWKFGSRWVNILSLSVAYKKAAIPLYAEVMSHKGNAKTARVIEIIKRFSAEFGIARIERIYADREFGTRELLEYLIEAEIDFHIRLKANHQSEGRSFRQMWEKVAERVKLKGRRTVEVFGVEVYVSCVKYRKAGKVEYLIVASRQPSQDAIAEYKTRWQIETMFGCLKSRGFDFEETHLTEPLKIAKLMLMLGLGLCLAMLMGEVQTTVLQRVKMKLKKNKRLGKSLFRVGLDALQNVLFNRQRPKKNEQLQAFIQLLSCT